MKWANILKRLGCFSLPSSDLDSKFDTPRSPSGSISCGAPSNLFHPEPPPRRKYASSYAEKHQEEDSDISANGLPSSYQLDPVNDESVSENSESKSGISSNVASLSEFVRPQTPPTSPADEKKQPLQGLPIAKIILGR